MLVAGQGVSCNGWSAGVSMSKAFISWRHCTASVEDIVWHRLQLWKYTLEVVWVRRPAIGQTVQQVCAMQDASCISPDRLVAWAYKWQISSNEANVKQCRHPASIHLHAITLTSHLEWKAWPSTSRYVLYSLHYWQPYSVSRPSMALSFSAQQTAALWWPLYILIASPVDKSQSLALQSEDAVTK